jgi:hypothetical protein
MSAGARLFIIPICFLSPPGLGLREKVVGVEDLGGVGARGEVFGLGLDIMEEIISEGLGLGAGLDEEAAGGGEDGPWRG